MMKLFNLPTSPKPLATAIASGLTIAAIGFASSAYADPISYLPGDTNIKFKYSNEEIQMLPGGAPSLYGIFNISAITNSAGSVNYWTGNGVSDGTQLVGLFYGLTPNFPGTVSPLDFSNGHMVIYNVANGSYNPGAALNADPTIAANMSALLCGGGACPVTPWVTADFVSGILDSVLNNTVTLNAAIAPTAPTTAVGSGYLNMAANPDGLGTGAHNAVFDSNQYTFTTPGNNPADWFLKSEFSACVNSTDPACTSSSWQVVSDDPVFARTVPEPATLALLGLGLLGLGMTRRGRKQA
jgi:hypothetical protein